MATYWKRLQRERKMARRRKAELLTKAQKAGAVEAVTAILEERESHHRRLGCVAMLRSETPRAARVN